MDKEHYQQLIRRSIEDLDRSLKDLQERYIRAALFLGYARDAVKNSGDNLMNYVTHTEEAIYIPQIVDTSVQYYHALKAEVDDQSEKASFSDRRIRAIASSAASVTTSTGAISDATGYSHIVLFDNTAITLEDHRDEYGRRFSQLSPALGKTYKSIDESLYTTMSDPERSALFLARHAFDQLLDVLAPIDDVRRSPYWKLKSKNEDENPNAVWRIERIKYATSIHVKDESRSNTLIAQANQILSVYNTLNKAHVRGTIDQNVAIKAVRSMKFYLEDWVDALEDGPYMI
ncbi:MAG: hypothetical protein JXQ30_14175 [Spirochaetes bacterium]|nr:hypothetical protein [Spirochaetota bacterium]